MGILTDISDGLRNVITGAGTTVDKRVYDHYAVHYDRNQVFCAYRASWIMRKIVDMPARDMVRKRRAFQADETEVKALEQRERDLKLWPAIKKALQYGDLGGGAIFLGTNDFDLTQPISDSAELTYLHVFNRDELTFERLILDPRDPDYGEPTQWTLNAGEGGSAFIHPSRMIAFKGRDVPNRIAGQQSREAYWGDPVYTSVINAVQNADKSNDGFAGLIDEASVDTFKFKNLAQLLGTEGGEEILKKRVENTKIGQSIHRARILDAEDDWDTRQVNWANMDKVGMHYLSVVAAAADIPATKFLGKAPDGLNSTGEGDEQNYMDRLSSDQQEKLKPALDKIDLYMLDSPVEWIFPPLSEMTEAEKAEVFDKKSKGITSLIQAGALSADAVAEVAPAMLEKDGVLPGIVDAQERLPVLEDDPRLGEADLNDQAVMTARDMRVGDRVVFESDAQAVEITSGEVTLAEDGRVTIDDGRGYSENHSAAYLRVRSIERADGHLVWNLD